MTADPAIVGARVLAGLARGRQVAIASQRAKHEILTVHVRRAIDLLPHLIGRRFDEHVGPKLGVTARTVRRIRTRLFRLSREA